MLIGDLHISHKLQLWASVENLGLESVEDKDSFKLKFLNGWEKTGVTKTFCGFE